MNDLFEIDYKSRTPICDQIVNQVIRFKIIGALKPGDKLPSVRQTAIELGINPNTVQKAYMLLDNSGIIVSVSGKGSFIAEDSNAQNALIDASIKKITEAVTEGRKIGIKKEKIMTLLDALYKEDKDND